MRLKFLILALSIISLLPITGNASNTTKTFSWNETGSRSGVIYKSKLNDELRTFYSTISHSKSGEQRLYFSEYSMDLFEPKKYTQPTTAEEYTTQAKNRLNHEINKNKPPSTSIIKFNGQPIKMIEYLVIHDITNKFYKSFTPETSTGHKYLINLFKKSTSPIEVEFNKYKFNLPAKGFTYQWNNNGGKAI